MSGDKADSLAPPKERGRTWGLDRNPSNFGGTCTGGRGMACRGIPRQVKR